jgi:hypothetical protein
MSNTQQECRYFSLPEAPYNRVIGVCNGDVFEAQEFDIEKMKQETIQAERKRIIKEIEKLHISQSETAQMNESVMDFSEKLLQDFKTTILNLLQTNNKI